MRISKFKIKIIAKTKKKKKEQEHSKYGLLVARFYCSLSGKNYHVDNLENAFLLSIQK